MGPSQSEGSLCSELAHSLPQQDSPSQAHPVHLPVTNRSRRSRSFLISATLAFWVQSSFVVRSYHLHHWIFSSIPVLYSVGARSTPQSDNQTYLRHCQVFPSEQNPPSVGDCLSQRKNTVWIAREDWVPVLVPSKELCHPGQVISPPSASVKQGWKIRNPPHEVAESWRAEAVRQDLACSKEPGKGRSSFHVHRVPGFFPFSLSF